MNKNDKASIFCCSNSQEGLQPNSSNLPIQQIKQPFSLKVSELFKKHFITIVRYFLCIFLAFILISRVSSQKYNELSNGIAFSNDILLEKGIRGVFPPLSGSVADLEGTWQQRIITSLQNTTSLYRKYSLDFKSNGVLKVTSSDCHGDLQFKWYIFYYNICLKEKKIEDQENDMNIPNQKEDIQCITDDGKFVSMLTNSSIWTIHSNSLYIISETKLANQIDGNMLIFQRSSS